MRVRILKYSLSPELQNQRLMMPCGAFIPLPGPCLQNQNGNLVFWAVVPQPATRREEEPWDFQIQMTGQTFNWDDIRYRPMGTVQIEDLVFHVFVCINADRE